MNIRALRFVSTRCGGGMQKHSRDRIRALLGALITSVPGLVFAVAVEAAPIDDEMNTLCRRVQQLREENNFEAIEQKKKERWQLLAEAAKNKANADSPWIVGYQAIRAVDGDRSVLPKDLDDPGLLNRLQYKAAAEKLRKALEVIAKPGDEPFLGDVAVRFFEVTHQALACYRNAMDEASPDVVATNGELAKWLKEAARRDPCSVIATPLLYYVEDPDPKEAFLRAENRPDFMRRQADLVKLSHRLTHSEHQDEPVLSWHAPVELDKSRNLRSILRELHYGSYLRPEYRGSDYVMPGKVIMGTDRLGDPFALIYGRILMCRVQDKQGNIRTAEMFLNEDARWECRYLNLVYRQPDDPSGFPLDALVNGQPARSSFLLGPDKFIVVDFPIDMTEKLLMAELQQYCVKDAITGLAKLKWKKNSNVSNELEKLESSKTKQRIIGTSPPVKGALDAIRNENDKQTHPLTSLLATRSFNPLMLVSESDAADASPNFFRRNNGLPYLLQDDGAPLYFDLSKGEGRPCCYVEYPSVKAFMPLSMGAIPSNLLVSGALGNAFAKLLRDVNYSEEQVVEELRKVCEDRNYVPAKYKAKIDKLSKQRRQAWDSILASELRDAGYSGNEMIYAEAMTRMFGEYGFRYLRDSRNNWILNSRFAAEQGVAQGKNNAGVGVDINSTQDLAKYPFAFRAQDGKTPIGGPKVYAWKDYQQLKANLLREHLNKVLAMHPCVPVWDLVLAEVADPLENPSRKPGTAQELFDQRESPEGKMDSFQLTAPYAAWMVGDNRDLQESICRLNKGYADQMRKVVELSEELAVISSQIMQLRRLESFIWRSDRFRQWYFDKLDNLRKEEERVIRGAIDANRALTVVQLEQARELAERKRLHRSMVLYNDLLVQQAVPGSSDMMLRIFEDVGDEKKAKDFADSFSKMVDQQKTSLTAQLELAGVLNAAGLRDSAYTVWQGIVDTQRYLVMPTVKLAEDIMTAYGIQFSESSRDSLRSYEGISEAAADAVKKYRLAPTWRVADSDTPEQKKIDTKVKLVRDSVQKQEAGKALAPDEQRIFEEALESFAVEQGVAEVVRMDFGSWLGFRRALLPRGIQQACRPLAVYAVPPTDSVPRTYKENVGFETPVKDVLTRCDEKDVLAYCSLPEDQSRVSPIAADACFLLAWYWLDVGRPSQSRSAWMELSNVLLARSAQPNVAPAEGLTDRLNALHAIVGGMSIFESVPGVAVIKSDLSTFLPPQVLKWERDWFAAGLYSPHAAAEARRLERQARLIAARKAASDASWRTNRYFFPDYTFGYGPLPDWLVSNCGMEQGVFDGKPRGEKGPAKSLALTEDDVSSLFKKLSGELDQRLQHRKKIVELAK